MPIKTTRAAACILFVFLASLVAHGQKPKPTHAVKLHYEENKLWTIVDGRKHSIDDVSLAGPEKPNAIVDPKRQNVYYVKNTGCGFENEGTTLFVSDVFGRNRTPILARCEILTPARFLSFKGRSYLLITQENGGTAFGTSFWLFETRAGRFEIHGEGQITQRRNGTFAYGFFEESEELRRVGTVTMQTLLNRGRPLRLLARQPTRALTKNKDTRLVFTDAYCSPLENGEFRSIEAAGSEVLVAEECPDGDYQVYFQGSRGKVARRDLNLLRTIQISSR